MHKLGSKVTETVKQNGIWLRPTGDSGLWLMFLLPVAFIISFIKHPKESSQVYQLCSVLSVGFIGTNIIFIIQCVRKKRFEIVRTMHLIPAAIAATMCRMLLQRGLSFSLFTGMFASIFYWSMLVINFRQFPKSFTVGELALAVQALVLFIYGALVNIFNAMVYTPTNTLAICTIMIQIGLCAIGLICFLTYRFKALRTPIPFFILTLFTLFFFIVLFLQALLRQNALVWILNFVFNDSERLKMVIYWTLCSIGAVIATNHQIRLAKKATPTLRKVFHIFAVAVFLPGLLHQCSLIYLASGVVFGVFISLEMLRILRIPPIGDSLQSGFMIYRDEKDTGEIALTPIYLLAGCAMPLWIHPVACDILDSTGFYVLPMLSGILAIGVGDTFAGIIGTSIGKHYWPGTKKTMEGTLGCIISQLVVIYVLIYFKYIPNNENVMLRIIIAVISGSLAEASTTQIDNIVLPLILYIILI